MQKKNLKFITSLVITGVILSCSPKKETKTENSDITQESSIVQAGIWRMEMDLGEKTLPFNFTLDNSNGLKMTIINAEERIEVSDIEVKGDSLFIKLPVFESEFKLVAEDSTHLKGVWINYYKGPDYKIPVQAEFGKSYRFTDRTEQFQKSVNGKYAATFGDENEEPYPAIGLLNQSGNDISGTFATETGDYRHLDGNFINDSIYLSTFDGSHAFLFEASYTDSLIKGNFWSGTHYKTSWTAKRNDTFKLRNPDSLTFLKEGYDSFSFELPDSDGNMISLDDPRFREKVVIVQIMGSWCPNCLDESNYLSSIHKRYQKQGLEVVALAFERSKSKEQALKNIASLKDRVKGDYPILLASWSRDTKATDVLPMLNHIMSYPTAIFIDKKGDVRKIHTGFYGPGTGEYYDRFTQETEAFIQKLLAEKLI